jgi:hypothetical protein
MKQIVEMAVAGGLIGGAATLSRSQSDPDGWAQVALGVVVFAAFGALMATARAAWMWAARRRHQF